jgi:hypothetical protein
MQMFVAELSNPVDKGELERSWQRDSAIDPNFKVGFGFAGQRISITVESSHSDRWQSDSFRRTFSRAVRRVDQRCNIRWI